MLVLNLLVFENKQYCTAYYRFHENSPYGEIPTKKEPIRTLGFASRPPCHIIKDVFTVVSYGKSSCVLHLADLTNSSRRKEQLHW